MAERYPDFVAFIEGLVLPVARDHADWLHLDGRRAGDPAPATRPKRIAYILHEGLRYGVDRDARIDRLLAPYRAWQDGTVEYPVIVGKTRNGRPMLVPAPGTGTKMGFYIYLQGTANAETDLPTTVSIALATGADLGPGEISELIREACMRAKRDAAFRKRIFKRWGIKCALTGCEDEAVLDATHIDAHAKTGDNRASNGVPLRSDLHRLLDRGLLSIDMSGGMLIVTVAPSVRSPGYKALNGKVIRMPE